jgi:cofilin
MGKKLKWIVYKINNAKTTFEVDEQSESGDYDALRASLLTKTRTVRGTEKPDARYAVMDLEHDVGGGEGKRSRIVMVVWIPDNAETAVRVARREGRGLTEGRSS